MANGNALENMYNYISDPSRSWYTNSFEDFKNKYSTLEEQSKLFDFLKTEKAYTNSKGDFLNKYFPAVDELEPEVEATTVDATEEVEETEEFRLPFSYSDDSKTQVLLQKEETVVDSEGNPVLNTDGSERKNLVVNKDFFNLEDEDAVGYLEAQFGEAFNFKEVVYDKKLGFSGAVVSTKDGKKSKTIEFNIKGRPTPNQNIVDAILKKQKEGKPLSNYDENILRQVKEKEEAYEIAYNDLVSFMDENSTDETIVAINEKEQKIRQVNTDFNNYIKQDIEAIEAKYSEENPNFDPTQPESDTNSKTITRTDLFEPETKTTYTPTGKVGTNIYKQAITTQPYEKELKLAMTRLGVNKITQEVKDEAKNIIIENERISLKETKITEMLEELEDGEILPASLVEYKDDTDALKAVLTVGSKMFQQEYAVKTEVYRNEKFELETNKDILAYSTLSKQLNDPNYNFEIPAKKELDDELAALGDVDENSSQEDINAYNAIVEKYKKLEPIVVLEDGREVPKRIMDQYEKERLRLKPKYENFFKLQNDLIDNRYNIQDSNTQLDLLRRDYNDWERFFVTTGTGFAELAINIGGATEDIEAHKRWAQAKAKLQEKRDEYAKPIAYEDAFKSWTNLGKFATVELGNQISIFTALAVPYAGWGTLLASSYGEQYGEMTTEEIETRLSFNELESHSDIKKKFNEMDSAGLIDLEFQTLLPSEQEWNNMSSQEKEDWKNNASSDIGYSLFRKIGQSAGYAIPELAFELATTVPLLRGAGNALKGLYGSSIRDLTYQGVKEGIKSQTPRFITGSLAGSMGEGGTTLTQNIVTGRPWHENVEHSMFSGLMFESTLASVPLVTGTIVNTLSDYTSNEEFRNNLIVSNKLVQDNKNLDKKINTWLLKGDAGDLSKIEQAENDKRNNKEKIDALATANETILEKQKQGITGRWLGWGKDNKNGMSDGAFQAYLEVTTQQEQLRIQAEKILSLNITKQEKNRRLKDLKENGFTDANGKKYNGFDLLQGARDTFRKEKNSEFNLWAADKNNEAKLNEYLEKAQDMLDNPNADRTPGWVKGLKRGAGEREDIARILFNIDKINENLGIVKDKKGRPTNLEKDLNVYQTVEEAISKMAELGIDAKVIQSIKDGSHGFDGPNNQSYIVVENMAKDDRLEIKTHELSHRFLRNAIAENPEAFREISQTIFEWAKTNDEKLYARLLRQAITVDSAPDEIIAVFLEEAAGERIDLKKKGIAGIIGYMTGNVMQEGYGVDMDFAGESDAIKMLIGLGKKIKAGTLTLKDQEAIVKSEVFETAKRKGKFLDILAPKVPGAVKMSKAKGSQTTVKEDLFTETNNALIEALEMYGMKNPERLLSEDINVRKQLAKEWEALGDSRFWIGTVIGEKWRTFVEVNYLQKRDKAANYELYKDQILDVVTTGIESGDNGIPFLVRSWKPAEEGGRTLTSHIFGEVETRLMKTDGIIDRKFPQFDKFTVVIDAAIDEGGVVLEGDLGVEAVLEAEKKKKERKKTLEEDRYRKLIGVDDKFAAEIKSVIKEVLLAGDLGLISDFDWTQRFSKAAQKKLFTIIKKEMKDYEAFLKKTRKPFVKHAHTSDLVQMEKNEKNKIFTTLKAVNASPNKIKLALLEGLIQPFEIKSMTQGPNVYEKVDTKEQEFIDFMKVRGRKDAFVKNNINIMAMDAVFDVLLNETIEVDGKQVRVLDEFIRQQREKGLPHVSNVLSIVKERINRDQDVKFSSTVRNFNNLDLRKFYGKLDVFGSKIDLINIGDEDAVKLAVEETWGDDYGKTTIKALSKDLFKLVKRYATINKNHTNLKTQPEQSLNEYLYDNIKAAELELNLAEYLELKDENGKLMKFSELFDDTGRLNNQRSAIIDFGKKLIEKYGREKALMMMVHAGGMYSTSTQISRGNHLVNDSGKIYKITEDQITKLDKKGKRKTQFSSQRYQSFTGKKDWNVNVMQVVFPELKLTKAKNLEKFQNLDGVVDEKGKLKKIDTSLLAESSEKGMEDRNFEAREAQAKLSEEFVKDIAQYYKDNKALDKIDFGMLMMSMSSNMQSPLKRAANLKYIYKDKKGKKYKGEFRYEHMIPTNFMVLKITDAYMNNKSDVDLDVLFKEYTVAIIPVTMDKIMEEMNFVDVMPIGFEAGQSSRVRYYNMSTYGHPDLYAIESLDPKDKGKVYGEGVANIKFSRNINKSNIINDAIIKARTVKFSEASQGITVLDFDDTLATTESLVRFTAPDGTKGTLNAEQYASQYQDLLGQGYKFDFTEFDKVVKGKLAPLFQKALKLQKKFGPENMFVLTARPPAAQKAIFDFLKANGLNIPLKNITGLGDSTAEAKALWVVDKVGEGYNDFYFADDALQNVQAVDNILSQFDVKRKIQQAKVKFSLSTKQDLSWKEDNIGYMTANFDVDGKRYNITLYPTDLNDTNYELEFDLVTENGLTQEMTGTGNQFKVLGIVYNGLLDIVKQKSNISTIGFSALTKDKSRAKVYTVLMDKLGKKLGWKTDIYEYGSGTQLDFEVAKPKALKARTKTTESIRNIPAVKNILNQSDIKSPTQQAKVKFSKGMNIDFNDILENVTGIESKKRFSAIKARKRGASKGKFRFFIPPSHEDFVGLLYNFIGKGKEGNAHRDFFEQALIRPLNRAYRELNTAKQSIANDYKSLNKEFKDVRKKLNKKTPDGDFTYQDAIRVYLWNKHGHKVPGLSETDQQKLVDLVMSDAELQAYAETLNVISKQDTYVSPIESWEAGDIRTDLDDATGRVGRAEYFTEFFENADIIFSQENLNKIEAAYGADVVSALKDILYRTKTGRNRPSGQNKMVNQFLNYLNGSVASTMFFNIRSAVLQQMSMVNFINFADNNVYAAAKAFANQKQYWTDWATIFNSDFMKQRRAGIKTDVNGAELAASVKNATNPIQAAIKKLLELGFLPTQIGDNIAIATGGATFYRNRINTYLKQGLSQKEAESKAWTDFQILAEATQQSARPDMVSQQQASPLGKIILAFQNVTSQFNRLGKKAFLDIKNRRITPGNTTQLQSDMSNLSRIAYYFAIQNLIFYSLQSALFMAMFDDDEEDERWLKKKERVVNGSIDSVLRGTGVWGSAIATLKNMAIKWHEQRDKGWNKDESAVLMEMLNVSPPLGIKARKLVNAEKTLNYNKDVIDEMETFDIDNPQWSAVTNYVEATTNVPLNRLYNKTQNVRESLNNQHDALERALMFGGWSKWNLGIGDSEKIEAFKKVVKEKKKIESKKKSKIKREEKKKVDLKEKEVKGIEKQKKEKKEGKQVTCLVCKLPIEKGKKYCTVHEKKEQRKDGKKRQCRKYKENGKRCGMQTASKSGYCYYHD